MKFHIFTTHGHSFSVVGIAAARKYSKPGIHLIKTCTGHSMTIIGFEVRKDGTANLLVFDPTFKTSPAIKKAIGKSISTQNPAKLLKIYRRGSAYLHKYQEFEILKLCG
jgi:hypothetical protein